MEKNSQNVTVVIPTMNRAKDLERCIRALLKQNFNDFDIFVIDNNSTDRTSEILSRYDIRSVRFRTNNLTSLFNNGWKLSENGIIAYLNDDSEPSPEWLEEAISSLEDPTVDCVGGPTIDVKPREISRLIYTNDRLIARILRIIYEKIILGNSLSAIGHFSPVGAYSIGTWLHQSANVTENIVVDFVSITNMAIRKSLLEKFGGFDENLLYNHADGDLFVRMKNARAKVLFNPKMIVRHHVNPEGRVRNQFYLGRDFAFFLLKDFFPKNLKNFIRIVLFIGILSMFWVYKSGTLGSFEPINGIVGLKNGFKHFMKVKSNYVFKK